MKQEFHDKDGRHWEIGYDIWTWYVEISDHRYDMIMQWSGRGDDGLKKMTFDDVIAKWKREISNALTNMKTENKIPSPEMVKQELEEYQMEMNKRLLESDIKKIMSGIRADKEKVFFGKHQIKFSVSSPVDMLVEKLKEAGWYAEAVNDGQIYVGVKNGEEKS